MTAAEAQSFDPRPEALTLEIEKANLLASATYQVFAGVASHLLRVIPVGDFHVLPKIISCRPHLGAPASRVEDCFLTWVMSLWLECRGWPVLHGAGLEIGGQAILVLGFSGEGKSTLAAASLREGFQLLSDDLVPLERIGERYLARPSFPRLELRRAFARGKENFILKRGSFCPDPRPLRAIYVLSRDRQAGKWFEPRFHRLCPGDAMIECVRHSFAARTVAAVGLQEERLIQISHLASVVPVTRVEYASSHERLGEVCRRMAEMTFGAGYGRELPSAGGSRKAN